MGYVLRSTTEKCKKKVFGKTYLCPFMLQLTTSRLCIFWGITIQLYTTIKNDIQSAVQMDFCIFSLVTMLVTPESLSEKQIASTNLGWQKQRILHTVEHFIINNVSLLRSSSDKMSLHRQHQHHTVWRPKHTSVQPCAGLYVHHARRTKKNYFMHLRSNVGLNNLMTSYENLWVPQDTTRDSFLNMI